MAFKGYKTIYFCPDHVHAGLCVESMSGGEIKCCPPIRGAICGSGEAPDAECPPEAMSTLRQIIDSGIIGELAKASAEEDGILTAKEGPYAKQ